MTQVKVSTITPIRDGKTTQGQKLKPHEIRQHYRLLKRQFPTCNVLYMENVQTISITGPTSLLQGEQ